MPRKSRKAVRVVRRTLADGTVKEYRYSRDRRPKPEAQIVADTLGALIKAYRRSPEWGALKPSTQYIRNIDLLPLEQLEQLKVADIKRRDIVTLRNSIASARGNGAGTGFVKAASVLFGWAVEYEWIEHSPVHGIKRLPGGHLRAWTQQEADRAQQLLPEHLRRVVVLARYTGQRRGDLCALGWSAYDGAKIRLTQEKTHRRDKEDKPLVLPVHPALKAELDAWRRDATATTILTNTLSRPWRPQHLSRELPRWLERIGMPKGMNVHGLRKLAATALAEAGCTNKEIMAITGHRTLAMVQLYTESAEQERLAGAAVIKLANIGKTTQKRL